MATGNAPRGFPRILQWLLAGLMLIIGLAVGILGAKLALVGGTLYFALMGVVMVIAAVLIFRNRRGGILLYAVAFIASVIWAISDAELLAALLAPVCARRTGLPGRPGLAFPRQPTGEKRPGLWRRRRSRRGAGGELWLDVQIRTAGQRD